MSKQESRRFIPLAITVAATTLAPLVVFFCLVLATTDRSPRREPLSQLNVSGFWSPVSGGQGAFNIGPEATAFTKDLPPDAQWGRITFELLLQKPIRPRLQLFAWTDLDTPEPPGFLDLSQQVRGSGRNEIAVEFDAAADLFDAKRVQITVVSPAGANIAGLENIEVESFSFSQRWAQAWTRLFEHQPLTLRTINGIDSSRIAGRGVTIVFWAGFFLAMAMLLARRFVLRRRISLLAHTAVTIVVLVVLADLRNSADYARNANEAVTLRATSANMFEYLNEFERLTWFGPAVEFVKKNASPGQSYFLEVPYGERGNVKVTLMRLSYYAEPVRRSDNEDEADFALLWNLPQARMDQFGRSDEWKRRDDLPGKMFVFERIK